MAWVSTRRRREIFVSAQKSRVQEEHAVRDVQRRERVEREGLRRVAQELLLPRGARRRGAPFRRPLERRADEDVVREVVLTRVARRVRRPAPEAPQEPKVRDRRREREGRAPRRARRTVVTQRAEQGRPRRAGAAGRPGAVAVLRRVEADAPRAAKRQRAVAGREGQRAAGAHGHAQHVQQRRSRLVCPALPPLPGRHQVGVEIGTDRGQQQRRSPHQLPRIDGVEVEPAACIGLPRASPSLLPSVLQALACARFLNLIDYANNATSSDL